MAAANTDPVLVVATKSGEVEVDGLAFVLEAGNSRLAEGHPLVKARPDLFEPRDQTERPKRRRRTRRTTAKT
jgi:hypothetical protein